MADEEHIYLLQRGVTIWNQWRKEHPDIQPNLHEADLNGIHFSGADLHKADLSGSYLGKATLVATNLYRANLNGAHLFGTDLRRANLNEAHLCNADLRKADLSGAYLRRANFTDADLSGTILNKAILRKANLTGAIVNLTIFGDVDLSGVKGIDMVKHRGPSILGIDTIIRSQGNIPDFFLRNAGIPGSIIERIPSFLGSLSFVDYYTCFISYSSKDQPFTKQLYTDLQNKGVRCWFAPEDLKIGDHYHQRVDESIRLYDKLILILSEHAIQSTWVEREVAAACEKEDREQRRVLFPLRLDDAVMDTTKAWAADVRRRWHIGDFTRWNNRDEYQQAFERLLRDLKAVSNTDDETGR
jgi:uncharacterized protein YjbI with pentapeptide repeats